MNNLRKAKSGMRMNKLLQSRI